MSKQTAPKRRSPTDATMRNTRAAKRREAAIEARLSYLIVTSFDSLEARIAALEVSVTALQTPAPPPPV